VVGEVKLVEMMGDEYVYIYLEGSTYLQVKFEYDTCIVGDIFTNNGDHVEAFMIHDFMDDEELGDDE
jgi:hypothetical protein